MSICNAVANFAKASVAGIENAIREIHKGNVETAVGLMKGELTFIDAIKKGAGHRIAAYAAIVSPSKSLSFVTDCTDSELVTPLAEFQDILYGRCGAQIKKEEIELALGVLVMLQNLSPRPSPEITEYQAASDNTFAEFEHWMKHATAAYGRNPFIHPGSLFACCGDDRGWIEYLTSMGKGDILLYENTKDVQDKEWLEYYLAVDRKKSAVVLSIMGTFTIKGALTDLELKYIEQGKYKYHHGILKASEALIEHIKDDITRALDANPTFSLVTCGHSLGASAAAVVAHLLSLKMPDGQFVTKTEKRGIHCYGIETAPSMCARASADYQGLISTLVHRNDIVPALSDGVLEDIKAFAGYLQENRDFLGGVYFSSGLMMAGIGDSKKAEEYLAVFKSLATNEKLVPPGMVYFMGKKDRLHFGRVTDASVAKHFGEARFVLGMLTDHFPINIMGTMGKFK